MKRSVPLFSFIAGLACLFLCAACSYYTIGGKKPEKLNDVSSIHVDTFKNNSYYPRAEVLLTSSIVETMTANGTFLSKAKGEADCTLRGTIRRIQLQQVRAQPYNTYKSLQTLMKMDVSYELVRGRDGEILLEGTVSVNSNFFNEGSQQSAKSNALSNAAQDAAIQIVSELVY